MKKHYSITVKGRRKTWSFDVLLNSRYLDDYRGDGLIIDEVVNTVPEWLWWRLVKPWCLAQDVIRRVSGG